MNARLFWITTLASLMIAPAAWAVPVYVTPRVEGSNIGSDLTVVAFSYDVRKLFPQVAAKFEQWRPAPPTNIANAAKLLPAVPNWNVYRLVHMTALMDFRQNFLKSHQSDQTLIKLLMPRFDAVFRKYGEKEPEADASDTLAPEDSRKVWCDNVTHDLNAIINAYNAGIGGGDAANAAYRETYARWLGKRNEALRQAVARVGGNPDLGFVESSTNDAGLAVFDLPPGRWYIAAQYDAVSWYKPVIVPPGGGRVMLRPEEATHEVLNLPEWTGN